MRPKAQLLRKKWSFVGQHLAFSINGGDLHFFTSFWAWVVHWVEEKNKINKFRRLLPNNLVGKTSKTPSWNTWKNQIWPYEFISTIVFYVNTEILKLALCTMSKMCQLSSYHSFFSCRVMNSCIVYTLLMVFQWMKMQSTSTSMTFQKYVYTYLEKYVAVLPCLLGCYRKPLKESVDNPKVIPREIIILVRALWGFCGNTHSRGGIANLYYSASVTLRALECFTRRRQQ